MPNWEDENGRFWYKPEGAPWYDRIEVPHAPVTTRDGCTCAFCRDHADAGSVTPSGGVRVVEDHGGPRLRPQDGDSEVTEAANAIRGTLNLYTTEQAYRAVLRVLSELRDRRRRE